MAVLNKFDPGKTMYFRGFSGIDSPAAMHGVSGDPTSGFAFTVSGVFRDPAAFWVLVLFDIDDFYGHPRIKPLPDGDLTGVVLEFDVTFSGAVGYDCPKFPAIDWPFVDYVLLDGTVGGIDLSLSNAQYLNRPIAGHSGSYAAAANTTATTVSGGTHPAAAATITFALASPDVGDELFLWFENYLYTYVWSSGDTAATAASAIAAGINAQSYVGNIYGLSASASGAAVTITASVPGVDGNMLRLYWGAANTVAGGDASTRVSISGVSPGAAIQLIGGVSACAYHVTLDFSALGIASVRQLVLTFAPLLADSAAYIDPTIPNYGTKADIAFTNWRVTADPNGLMPLSVAGPGSVRAEETDAWTTAVGTWNPTDVGWFSQGFAIYSSTPGDSISVTYWSQFPHELWLGTSVYSDRGIFGIVVDGTPQVDLDMMLAEYPLLLSTPGTPSTGNAIAEAVSTRRRLASGLAAGQHTVVLTVKAGDTPPTGIGSHGFCYFDFLEAVVASDVPAPPGPWLDRFPAFDFDTQHGYQLAPARLLWMCDALGFAGPANLYVGVFWWNQRNNPTQTFAALSIDFATLPDPSLFTPFYGQIFIDIGGTTLGKTTVYEETAAIWAEHFAYYINETFGGVWASVSGSVLTITVRSAETAAYAYTFSAGYTENYLSSPTLIPWTAATGSLETGSDPGTWQIDTAQTSPAPINWAAENWMADLFAGIKARGNVIVASFSMELVYPPDVNTVGSVWAQRFIDGTVVLTSTGFESYISTQCAPMAVSFLAYQKAVYVYVAGLQAATGLTPYLQFGEFLWWFFSALWLRPIGSVAVLSYVRLGFATPHGLAVGEEISVANLKGIPSVNGTWTVVDVPDSTHVDITAPYGGGSWVSGTGLASGGSMAYYDAETTAAALLALPGALYPFALPTDDPGVHSFADANFLADRLAAHVAAIVTSVQATYPDAVFEILWPGDVNGPNVTPVSAVGGALNNYVNFPVDWRSATAAPFQLFKLEALAFSTTDRNIDFMKATLAYVRALAWPLDQLRFLYSVDTPGVELWSDYRLAKGAGFAYLTPFAIDQVCLVGWRLDPPAEEAGAQVS